MKINMHDQLYELLLKLPKENIINLMYSALDEMQMYNGRTITQCICTSLGCEEEEKDGKSYWKLPTLKVIKERTKYPPPY